MFKILGWIFILFGLLFCFTLVFIGYGIPLLFIGGIFLCIHKYLGRDNAARPDYYYDQRPLPRPSPPSQPISEAAATGQGSAPSREMPFSQFGR